ncbi:hypothetical protein [Allorhizobium sonneratiae]|uniref:hypothetical protein n=1 Tax=Allorhizobium sonneratiae TaxID=2934936 RepID=UPI00203409A9|nr:hypothetical protein [Allorhizobium sonneratiae]
MKDGFTNEKCGHETKIGEDAITGTDHAGKVYLQNDWGAELYSATIRHRRSNDPNKQEEMTFNNVPAGAKVGPMPITYTTGAGSPFDYWWIKFVLSNGTVYSCKGNFYCYISSSDDGNVLLRIDGSDKDMYVSFSSSSGCYVSLDTVPGSSPDNQV